MGAKRKSSDFPFDDLVFFVEQEIKSALYVRMSLSTCVVAESRKFSK